MKFKIKKSIIMIGSVVMVLVITISASAVLVSYQEKKNKEMTEKEILVEMEKQKQAVAADNALMNYYFKENEGIVYPDYFAGRYIEDGIYYLCLNDPPEGTEEAYNEIFGENKGAVKYLYKDYSYNALKKQADEILNSLHKFNNGVISASVDQKTGAIRIGVLSDQIENVKNMFSTIYASKSCPNVEFVEDMHIEIQTSTLYGGAKLTKGSAEFTLGVHGIYQGAPAFLTAGHAGNVGDRIYGNGKYIGSFVFSRYSDGSYGDFAIGAFDSTYCNQSHIVGNSTRGFTVLTDGTVFDPAVGTVVRKYGDVSGYALAQVTDVGMSFMPDNSNIAVQSLTRSLLVSGSSAMGDSGGPYMAGSAFCGIHHGESITNLGNRYFYFTPYSIINAAGFTAKASHEGHGWTDYSSATHVGFCLTCNATVYDEHQLFWSEDLGRCTRCGRTDPISTTQ